MISESVHGMYENAVCFEVVCEGQFWHTAFVLIFFLLSVYEELEVRFYIGLWKG